MAYFHEYFPCLKVTCSPATCAVNGSNKKIKSIYIDIAMHRCLARFYYLRQRVFDQPHKCRILPIWGECNRVWCGTWLDNNIRFNSNVRWSTSPPGRVPRHRTPQYYRWVSSPASRHRSCGKDLNHFFSKTCLNQWNFDTFINAKIAIVRH